MGILLRSIDKLNQVLMFLSALILGGTVILILAEIFLWNVFEATTLVADEYSAYGLAIIVFWGAGITLKQDGHIRITLITSLLPQFYAKVLDFLATAVTTAFATYLVYYLYRMVSATFRYNSTSGTLSNTPLWIPQALLLLGCIAFALQLLARTIRSFQALR